MSIKLSELLKDVKIYYYFIYSKNNKKVKYLFSSNKRTDIKKKIKFSDNKILIQVSLKRVSKKKYNLNKKSPIKTIGGPLYCQIKEYEISNINNKIRLKNIKSNVKNKVYFSKSYLLKKSKISNKKWIKNDINKVVKAFVNKKLNNKLLAINLVHKIK